MKFGMLFKGRYIYNGDEIKIISNFKKQSTTQANVVCTANITNVTQAKVKVDTEFFQL